MDGDIAYGQAFLEPSLRAQLHHCYVSPHSLARQIYRADIPLNSLQPGYPSLWWSTRRTPYLKPPPLPLLDNRLPSPPRPPRHSSHKLLLLLSLSLLRHTVESCSVRWREMRDQALVSDHDTPSHVDQQFFPPSADIYGEYTVTYKTAFTRSWT